MDWVCWLNGWKSEEEILDGFQVFDFSYQIVVLFFVIGNKGGEVDLEES